MQWVPPNGFIGNGQQTMATQMITGGMRSTANGTRRRRRKTKKRASASSTRKRKASRRSTKRPARLVKGSAAAKRYMAKIRRKRRK